MAEIRSVSVHLDADVASYIAKMKLAGAATDEAFGRAGKGVTSTNTKLTTTERQIGKVDASVRKLGNDVESTRTKIDNGSRSIDKYSGRLGLMVSALTAVGPAIIPIAGVAVPAVAALGSGLGFAAVGAGTFALAFRGVGDALTKFNKASLEPTAANIQAAHQAMSKLSPDAQAFVLQLHQLGPELQRLQRAAGAGLFPGLSSGLRSIRSDAPLAQHALHTFGSELGGLARDAGRSLSSNQWRPFLRFAGTEGPRELGVLGHAVGNVAHGAAELWMAMSPLNRDVDAGILRLAQDFDRWATSLGKTKDFQSFVQYLETNGPRVVSLLGDVGQLFVDIVKAAAPLGGPTVQALDLIVKLLDAIASSPLATPLLLLAQINAVLKLTSGGLAAVGVNARLGLGGVTTGAARGSASLRALRADAVSAGSALRTIGSNVGKNAANGTPLLSGVNREGLANLAKGAALAGGMAFAMSGLDQKMGLTNTTALTMAGTLAGPYGAAAGAAAGFTLDVAHANDDLVTSVRQLKAAFGAGFDFSAQAQSLAATNTELDRTYAKAHQFTSLGASLKAGPIAALSDLKVGINEFFTHDVAHAQDAVNQAGFDYAKNATIITDLNNKLVGSMSPVALSTSQLQATATRAAPAMQALGISTGDLQAAYDRNDGSLDRLVGRIVAWTNRASSARGQTRAVASAFEQMSNNALTVEQRVTGLTSALDGLIDPRVSLSQLTDQWNDGLRHLAKNLDNDHGQLLANTDAASKNRDVLRNMVETLKQQVEAQAKVHPGSTQLAADFERQRKALINAAQAAGENRGEVIKLLREMGLMPKDITTYFHLNGTQQTLADIRAIRTELGQLHDRTIVIRTTRVNTTGGHSVAGNADGGTIPGPRYPYGDKVLRFVAPGEEVVSNRFGQADRHRQLLKAINAGRMADGGTVGGGVSVGTSSMGTDGVGAVLINHLGHALHGVAAELQNLQASLKRSSRELDKERQHRQDLVQQRQSIVSQVSSNFMSDLFGTTTGSSSIWGPGAAPATATDPLAILRQDIANARKYRTDIRQLRRRGLSKAALGQIDTLDEAEQASGMTNAQLREFSRLYAIRQRAAHAAGAQLGDIEVGKQLRQSTNHLAKLNDRVHHLNEEVRMLRKEQKDNLHSVGVGVGQAINKGATTAVRRKRGAN